MRVVTVGLSLSAVRISALWFLIFREWGHQQSITLLPLLMLLYPEGLLLPDHFWWSWGWGIGFSGALLLGSFLITSVVFAGIRALKS